MSKTLLFLLILLSFPHVFGQGGHASDYGGVPLGQSPEIELIPKVNPESFFWTSTLLLFTVMILMFISFRWGKSRGYRNFMQLLVNVYGEENTGKIINEVIEKRVDDIKRVKFE